MNTVLLPCPASSHNGFNHSNAFLGLVLTSLVPQESEALHFLEYATSLLP